MKPWKVIVTGDPEELGQRLPSKPQDTKRAINWTPLPVIRFRTMETRPTQLPSELDWVLFSSPRGAQFFSQFLDQHSLKLNPYTRFTGIGERTKTIAEKHGFKITWTPTNPGTEGILKECHKHFEPNSKLLLPGPKKPRPTLRTELEKRGHRVTPLALYETLPNENIKTQVRNVDFEAHDLMIFTSPSSFEAFQNTTPVPPDLNVAGIGKFTTSYLVDQGLKPIGELPFGDFNHIGELLCRIP